MEKVHSIWSRCPAGKQKEGKMVGGKKETKMRREACLVWRVAPTVVKGELKENEENVVLIKVSSWLS